MMFETPIQVHSKALQAYRLKGLFHPHPAPLKSDFSHFDLNLSQLAFENTKH